MPEQTPTARALRALRPLRALRALRAFWEFDKAELIEAWPPRAAAPAHPDDFMDFCARYRLV